MNERMSNSEPRGDYGSSLLADADVNQTNGENKIRNISIQQLNRGYVVNVGCHNFAISTDTELISLLSQYIANPNQTERKWFDGKLF